MITRRSICIFASLAVHSGLACADNQDTKGRAALAAFAETALGDGQASVHSEVRQAGARARKNAFAEKKQAAADAKKQQEALLAGLANLPKRMPPSLKTACDDLLGAYTGFVVRSNADNDRGLMNFYDNKRSILGERRGKCVKLGSIKAAACQARALGEAPASMRGEELTIMNACVAKFAPQSGQQVAAASAPAN
ncbi:MAG: hypothetical protein V3V08_06325 [Nannocystaceae bacterium]